METGTTRCGVCGREYSARLAECPRCASRKAAEEHTAHQQASAGRGSALPWLGWRPLVFYGLVGLVVGVIGWLIAYAAWPETKARDALQTGGQVEETGSTFLSFVGLLLASVGNLVLFVSTVALAVAVGIRAARD